MVSDSSNASLISSILDVGVMSHLSNTWTRSLVELPSQITFEYDVLRSRENPYRCAAAYWCTLTVTIVGRLHTE